MKIAIVAHCHYLDLAEKIFDYLSIAPYEFDIFVTTSEGEVAEAIASKADAMKNFGSCQIVVGPNRGRNFAQFLVEFRSELKQYDLICHVHTKKSLLRSDSLAGWGEYLIENLIGSSALWESTIDLFEQNPNCGLAYPETYAPLPFWSEHWLGNHAIAQEWGKPHGLRFSPGFVRYPVGGMFWARPAAIEQLLNHDWNYSLFPSESAQPDGTMHHAVERLIGATSTANGFQHYIYIPSRRQYRKTDAREYRYDPNFSARHIAEYISAAQCVSFDLFSLTKKTKIEAEKTALEKVVHKLCKERLVDLGPLYTARRQLAELQSRFDHRHTGNMSFQDIVALLAGEFDIDDTQTLEQEADFAGACLELDMRMGQIYRSAAAAGKEISVVAECAYDQSWMENVLIKLGLNKADYYFTTSQMPGLCADGSIWSGILHHTNRSAADIIHFGKDLYSDYLLLIRIKSRQFMSIIILSALLYIKLSKYSRGSYALPDEGHDGDGDDIAIAARMAQVRRREPRRHGGLAGRSVSARRDPWYATRSEGRRWRSFPDSRPSAAPVSAGASAHLTGRAGCGESERDGQRAVRHDRRSPAAPVRAVRVRSHRTSRLGSMT